MITLSTPSAIVAGEMRAAMGRRRMTHDELAKKMGRDRTYFTRRLKGDRSFTIDEIVDIAQLLGVSTRTLLAPLFEDQ